MDHNEKLLTQILRQMLETLQQHFEQSQPQPAQPQPATYEEKTNKENIL
ncbi:MAG: hypothetical protein ACKO96_04995 [Flammeovirgaceae bacterium]